MLNFGSYLESQFSKVESYSESRYELLIRIRFHHAACRFYLALLPAIKVLNQLLKKNIVEFRLTLRSMNILSAICCLVSPAACWGCMKTCRMAGWVARAMLPRLLLSRGTSRHTSTVSPSSPASASNPSLDTTQANNYKP